MCSSCNGNNWWWIIILILLAGGFSNDCGCGCKNIQRAGANIPAPFACVKRCFNQLFPAPCFTAWAQMAS